jgi:hypothetical protein
MRNMKNKIIKNSLYGTEPVLHVNVEMEKLFKKYFLKEVADVHRGGVGDNRKIHGIKKNEK